MANRFEVTEYKRRAPEEEFNQSKRSREDTSQRNTTICDRDKNKQANLLSFYNKFVAVDKEDRRECGTIVLDTLKEIIDHVKGQPGGDFYSAKLVKAGSYAVNTKIGKADEFDWLVPLRAMAQRVWMGHSSILIEKELGTTVIYEGKRQNLIQVPVSPSSGPIQSTGCQCIDANSVPDAIVMNGKLIPVLLKEDLQDKIKLAIEETGLMKKGVSLSSVTHGPALQLIIVRGSGQHSISVDITPSLPTYLPVTTNGWCGDPSLFRQEQIDKIMSAGTHFVPKEDMAFKLSYSKAETALYKHLDGPNECRKMCHKVIKKYVQMFSSQSPIAVRGISSYIFKHQLLHLNEKLSGSEVWRRENFYERLLDMLLDCARVLKSGQLPNYFNSSENLLEGKDTEVLNRLADFFLAKREELMKM